MPDRISKERRSENMRRIGSRNTEPELRVRRILHGMGYRYRLHRRDLAGTPDIVLGPRRKVIFVHGCFWHNHEDSHCSDGRKPSSNRGYWDSKLQRNKQRDVQHLEELREAGWQCLVIWECQTADAKQLASVLRRFLGKRVPQAR